VVNVILTEDMIDPFFTVGEIRVVPSAVPRTAPCSSSGRGSASPGGVKET